jgi:SPP1 family predicted phage head-tail adaptor
MTIGALRHRITFQSPTSTGTYSTVETQVPAAIEFVTPGGNEQLLAGAPTTIAQSKITVRHRTDVRAEWRIVDDDSRTFQIAGYGDPSGDGRWLQIACMEIQ